MKVCKAHGWRPEYGYVCCDTIANAAIAELEKHAIAPPTKRTAELARYVLRYSATDFPACASDGETRRGEAELHRAARWFAHHERGRR